MSDFDLRAKLEHFLQGTWTGTKRIQGIQGGARAYLLSLVAEKSRRPILVVAPTASTAENLYDDLAFFLGEERSLPPFRKRLHLFPSWEVLPFEKLSPHPDNVAARLEGLYKLVEEHAPYHSDAALLQKIIPKEDFKRSYLYLVAGQELEREALLQHLVLASRMCRWWRNGDFSVRGGIIDIFRAMRDPCG
jgi:transcription-repair coupling factor (superfamily II helicase)